jgi:hypothetical protein
MSSVKQVEANRLNAQKSTGPRSTHGKLRTRGNARRHGLTAVTVIADLENAEEYTAFEEAILADYRPRTTVEHALATRLASLLWRLRRSVAIETGLFEAQSRQIDERRRQRSKRHGETPSPPLAPLIYENGPYGRATTSTIETTVGTLQSQNAGSRQSVSRCFFQLTRSNNATLERIEKYEVSLWRQAAQILMLLSNRQERPSVAAATNK